MKKSVIISFLVLVVLFASPVSASVGTKAGIKPSSFFYFFDTAFEKVSMFFTFNPEKKAQKALGYANERLAEAEAVAESNDAEAIKTAIIGYESNITFATEKSKEVKEKGKTESLLASITDNTSRHQEILNNVLLKVPDEAKEAVTNALEFSQKRYEEATQQIAELKGEVEQLKKEVVELKKKDENQTKTIEELSNQKSETKPKSTPTATQKTTSQTSEVKPIPSSTTTSSQAQTQTNETQNTQPIIQPSANTTNTTPTPTTQTQTSTTIQISSVNITPSLISARIEWQTNIPTNSKIFLSGGSLSSKIYNSESGLSTRHIVNATGLTSGTTYSYEIESIASGQVSKKEGSFSTKPDEYTISVQPDKTSVQATGWNDVYFKIETLKNGKYQEYQVVSITTPDPTQNKTITTGGIASNGSYITSFTYYPKTVGTHTLKFNWGDKSKSIDIQAVEYVKVDPKIEITTTKTELNKGETNIGIGSLTISGGDEEIIFSKFNYESDIDFNGNIFCGSNCGSFSNGRSTLFNSERTSHISIQFNVPNNVGQHYFKITEISAFGITSGLRRDVLGLPVTFTFEIK